MTALPPAVSASDSPEVQEELQAMSDAIINNNDGQAYNGHGINGVDSLENVKAYIEHLEDAFEELLRLRGMRRELLEALEAMVTSYEYEASAENPALLQARAAIAKATK